MATSYNRKEIALQKTARIATRGTITGAAVSYYALNPARSTSIIVTHDGGDTPLISVTNTLNSNDDLEDATALYGQVYDGTDTPYVAGDSRGLTGIRIDANGASTDVEISIIQYGRR